MLDVVAIIVGIVVGILILAFCFRECAGYPDARALRPVPPRNSPRGSRRILPPSRPAAVKYSDKIQKPNFEHKLSNEYHTVGCPKCACPHKYGLDRPYLDCYQCGYAFDPELQGRKHDSYRKEKQ